MSEEAKRPYVEKFETDVKIWENERALLKAASLEDQGRDSIQSPKTGPKVVPKLSHCSNSYFLNFLPAAKPAAGL